MSFFGALSTQFGDLDGPNLDEVSQGVGWTDIVPSDPNDSANDRRLKDNYYNMKLFSTINFLKRLWALRYKNCKHLPPPPPSPPPLPSLESCVSYFCY
jgi:hypothetical protein